MFIVFEWVDGSGKDTQLNKVLNICEKEIKICKFGKQKNQQIIQFLEN